MYNKEDKNRVNALGFLVPLAIMVVAVFTTAAVFLIGLGDYQAREADKAVESAPEIKPTEVVHEKVILSKLPDNENIIAPAARETAAPAEAVQQLVARLVDNASTSTADVVRLEVPFAPQAPFAEWDDPRQDFGCEEASLLMAWHYINGEPLSYAQARAEIIALSDWEEEVYGEFRDSSAAHTVEIYEDYFEADNIRLVNDISVEDIKHELRAGHPVVVPLDGQILDNPYYTPPGPLHHMLVVIGFDDKTGEFITNDPGTRRGEGMRYTYENFYESIRDYESGHGEPVLEIRRPMIIIE